MRRRNKRIQRKKRRKRQRRTKRSKFLLAGLPVRTKYRFSTIILRT